MPLGEKDLGKVAKILDEKSIASPFRKIIIEFLQGLSEHVRISNVLLYGSVARGEAILGKSDIDMIIIAEEFNVAKEEIFKLKRKIRGKLPGLVESIWMSKKEFTEAFEGLSGFILDALYEGIILYDEDGFLKNMRERLLKAIEKGIIERYRNFWRFPKVKIGEKTEINI